jgi:hypothetical protein
MAKKYFWIGSTGPFNYDDEERVLDKDELWGSTPAPYQAPLNTTSNDGSYVSGPTPATAVNGGICGWEGTTGRLIGCSQALVDVAGTIAVPAGQDITIGGVSVTTGSGDFVEGPTPATSQTGGIVGWADTTGRLVGSSAVLVDIAGSLQIPTGEEIIVGQIRFPTSPDSSSNANTLDEYEEGTWTPTVRFGGTGVTTYTYRSGEYVKIGKVVNVSFRATISNLGAGSGDISIVGLPFTVGTAVGNVAPAAIVVDAGITYTGSFMAFAGISGTTLNMGHYTEAGTADPIDKNDCTATVDFAMQCTYEASA